MGRAVKTVPPGKVTSDKMRLHRSLQAAATLVACAWPTNALCTARTVSRRLVSAPHAKTKLAHAI